MRFKARWSDEISDPDMSAVDCRAKVAQARQAAPPEGGACAKLKLNAVSEVLRGVFTSAYMDDPAPSGGELPVIYAEISDRIFKLYDRKCGTKSR